MPGGADWNPEIEAKTSLLRHLCPARLHAFDWLRLYRRQRNCQSSANASATTNGDLFLSRAARLTPRRGSTSSRQEPSSARRKAVLEPRSKRAQPSTCPSAADEIAEVAKAVEERKAAASDHSQPVSATLPGLGSLLGPAITNFVVGGFERLTSAPESARAAPSSISPALPETGYERLVRTRRGACAPRRSLERRQDQHPLAHRRGRSGQVGAGQRMADAAASATIIAARHAVLGWSFYSQGSKERATAADEFLNWALAKLGVKLDTTSASAKGEAIAEALITRRVLLVLDGVEPLQHGPGPQAGQLKDQGLRALLRRFATAPPRPDHSLIVLTSRVAVADLQRFKDGCGAGRRRRTAVGRGRRRTAARQRRLGNRQGAKGGVA